MKDLRSIISLLGDLKFVDTEQVAYYGYSYGAAVGGILAAVEPRLKALVLASGTGGRNSLRQSDPMFDIDPIHYVLHIGNVPILLQNGEDDRVIPKGAALLYQNTVSSDSKKVVWYPTGHFLSCDATKEALSWLSEYIEVEVDSDYQCSRLPIL
ncbi:MAG: hypothetical protein R3F50_08210 [Gammaproteobacteria bacterium]